VNSSFSEYVNDCGALGIKVTDKTRNAKNMDHLNKKLHLLVRLLYACIFL